MPSTPFSSSRSAAGRFYSAILFEADPELSITSKIASNGRSN
jgi:hypothetical protein